MPLIAQCSLFCTVAKNVLRDLGVRVVVDAALLVDVGDLQVEAALAGADLADALEQLVEVVLAEARPCLSRSSSSTKPLTMNSLSVCVAQMRNCVASAAVDAVADGDDGVEVVELCVASDLAASLRLNYPEFPDSCLLGQFARLWKMLLEVLADRADVHAEQLGHPLLRRARMSRHS